MLGEFSRSKFNQKLCEKKGRKTENEKEQRGKQPSSFALRPQSSSSPPSVLKRLPACVFSVVPP